MNNLEIVIGNRRWSGWKSARVTRSIKRLADTVELSLTDRWTGNPDPRPIRADAPCTVVLNGITAITGYVFDVAQDYDAESHSIEVTGLSKAADLIDCSIKGRQFNGRNLAQIAGELAKPFGIFVSSSADIDEPFQKVAIETGQPIADFIQELSRIRGVRPVSLSNGDIAFVRTGTVKAPTPLVLGRNVKRASGTFSSSGRFSEYRVLGQSPGSDDWFGDQAANAEAVVSDSTMRHRPHTMIADGPATTADAKVRAGAEKNRRFGESRTIRYIIQGWQHKDGLWEPNTLVDVDDAYANIRDTWLIASVIYGIDKDGGSNTELEVAPRQAFDLVPLPEPKEFDWGW